MTNFKVAYVIPTWNGARLQETLDNMPSDGPVDVVSTRDRGWPLAAAWNYAMRKYVVEDDYDAVVITNDDVLLRPQTGQELAWGLLEAQHDPTQPNLGSDPAGRLLLVTGYNTTNHPDEGCRWGVGGPDYSCFAVGRAYWEIVGYFDEMFSPAYFEDNDSHRRIRLAGYEAAQWTPYFHYGSTTIDTDPERKAEVQVHGKFQANRDYYIRKWGGPPGSEIYTIPFNARAA